MRGRSYSDKILSVPVEVQVARGRYTGKLIYIAAGWSCS